MLIRTIAALTLTLISAMAFSQESPRSVSGIYPHLAMFNNEGECGTGAVVPWAGKLWVVTYAPHMPKGSSDKLYEIAPDLTQTVRPESIGGTPANRMIHRESNQLFIGPYVIDGQGAVRTIPYSKMFGRPTGNARHLFDPAGKVYCASMEEGLYEIDVKTLEVQELWADEQLKAGRHANLPGYHGKGLYSTGDRLIYANNGEHGAEALKRPDIPSGVLAEWDGKAEQWTVVRRNQFTEVTGPGGITGNSSSSDPVWSIGWDHRSLILMCLDEGPTPGQKQWHRCRLPKASHSYDGAHGWNTEWPRIREIGEDDLLMTMHGMFWRFPRQFSSTNAAGIRPRSTYLKVIGDFCKWQDRIVLGCDDTAKNEFLNKRKAKGEIAGPQSQSNLWFIEPEQLDQLGPVIGRGAVWLQDDVPANQPSDLFLFSGFELRGLFLAHEGTEPRTFVLEYDQHGNGFLTRGREITVPAHGTQWVDLSDEPQASWVRVTCNQPLTKATAWFTGSNIDHRTDQPDAIFNGIARPEDQGITGGLVRARGENKRTLHFVAQESHESGPREIGLYELDGALKLSRVEDATALNYQKQHAAIPVGVLTADAASIVFVDDSNRRWRLPRASDEFLSDGPLGPSRVCREVATERDLFNAGGTFFELPAENAGGFAKVRAVATHNRRVVDFCSYRGLFVMSGISMTAPLENSHIIRSDDGKTALWVGAIDDVWKFGKPRGIGGPWKETAVKAGIPSDPYLLTGYDRRTALISASQTATISLEVDITGTGLWMPGHRIEVKPGEAVTWELPAAYAGYWIRATSDQDTVATVQLRYE
jgi:hypothetical protein